MTPETQTKNPAAVALGRLGGLSRSPAKLAAQKINCQRAGRPKGAKDKHPRKRAIHPTDANGQAQGV